MGNINDLILTATEATNINEGLVAFYQDNGATSDNINEAEFQFLVYQGATIGNINDMWAEFLIGLGYSGNLSDMLYDYWSDPILYQYFFELVDSLDEYSGMVGSIARESAATYVDTDGILQTADGDSTPFSHDSVEDETGYTDMRGSFVDGQAWFDGEVLGSAVVDDDAADDDTADWFVDDCIITFDTDHYVVTETDPTQWVIYGSGNAGDLTLVSGTLYKVSFKIKRGTCGADSFYPVLSDIRSVNDTLATGDLTIPADWKSFVYYGIATSGTDFFGIASTIGAGETYFLKDVLIEPATSLADQVGTANLLIIDDGAAKGYGYIGEVGGGEVATALPNNITAISSADPGVIDSVAHDLSIGALVYFDSLTEMTELNTVYKVVTAVGDADHFSIDDTSAFAAETTGGTCGHEVTEPNATAVKIYKEYTLDNEGWNALDTGIDYNDAVWDFDVYANLLSASGSTAQARFEANGLLSEGEGTNWFLGTDWDSSTDWSVGTNSATLRHEGSINNFYLYVDDPNGGATTNTMSSDSIRADAAARSAQIEITGEGLVGGDITIRNRYISDVSVVTGEDYTVSFWIKTSINQASIPIQAMYGANSTFTTVANIWTYITYTYTASGTAADEEIRILLGKLGTYTVNIECYQFEKAKVATSWIPTTTIPVTRTTESNAWTMSTAFKNLMGDVANSPFTMVCEWTPKFSYGDTVGNKRIIVPGTANLFYTSDSGQLASWDDGNLSIVNPQYVAGTTYIFALRVYLDTTMKFEVGEKHGGSWSWDATPADYDGSFNSVTNFELGLSVDLPFNIKNIYFYDEAKEQAWIENKF